MFTLFSPTHFILLLGIPLMGICAYLLRNTKYYHPILFGTSFLLFLMEVWKQYEYYYVLHTWSVWITPFQLCSIPLYIWLFYPFKNKPIFQAIETFLIDYTLLGALFALGYPEDMIKVQLSLTIHSFTWHYLLVFISFFVYFTHHGELSIKGFFKGTIVFWCCCGIATLLNITLAKYGTISMFYIDPYHISTQPVFSIIGEHFGILIQNLFYIFSISLGALMMNCIFKKLRH